MYSHTLVHTIAVILDFSYSLYFGPLQGQTFAGLTSLRELVMGGNFYNSTIPMELATLPSLENLYIENSLVNDDLNVITKMPVIFELWMEDNPIFSTIPTEIGVVTTLGKSLTHSTEACGS